MPIAQVAKIFRLSWGTVADAMKRMVEYGKENRALENIRVIGIDEISRQKGHKYMTVVYDLERKCVLWVGKGRKKETLEKFFDWLGDEKTQKLEYVVMDMWYAYEEVTRRRAPQAVIVFDKFHIFQHLNKAIDEVRRQEQKNHKELRRTRWVVQKNPQNLTQDQEHKLKIILEGGYRVGKAWGFREAFRDILAAQSLDVAYQLWKNWFWRATHSRIEPIRRVAWMIRRHIDGVLAFIYNRYTNALAEGLNAHMKLLSRRARGFRNHRLFEDLILHILGDLPDIPWPHDFIPSF